jgi:hypothetical protein
MTTKLEHLGHEGHAGWRGSLADRVAPPAAKRGPVSEDQVRGAIGALFYVLSLYYVFTTTWKMIQRARD